MSSVVVLVTGGTGLVGSAIRDHVHADPELSKHRWVFQSSRDCDLRDPQATRKYFASVHPTHVIHLAAKVGGLFANMKHKVEFYRENILINDNVMESCRIEGVQKLVSCLSTCIFPDKTTYPIDETMLHSGPPHWSNEGYAYAKRMIDTLNRCYKEEYGCNFTSVIPTNIFGPYDNFALDGSHVVPALIRKCYEAKRDGKTFTVLGSGRPLRQFIFNRDLAKLMVWVLFQYHETEPVILSVDEKDEHSIGEVAHMVADSLGYEPALVFDTSAADGQFKKTASNAKLRRLLPDFQFTPIQDALKETCDWFVAHYDTARK
eukprot:m51a1_g10466 putative gdp-l-fucose synthetase (318) ;mRNA; r:45619-46922